VHDLRTMIMRFASLHARFERANSSTQELLCVLLRREDFWQASVELDEAALLALDAASPELVRTALAASSRHLRGRTDAGASGKRPARERIHCLCPESNHLQTAPVHTAQCVGTFSGPLSIFMNSMIRR